MHRLNRKIRVISWVTVMMFPALAWSQDPAEKGKEQPPAAQQGKEQMADPEGKFGYLLGWRMGGDLENFPVKLDAKALIQAIGDRIEGRPPKYDKAAMDQIRVEMMGALQKEKTGHMEAMGEKNRAAGLAFMTENAKKPGVVTTPSGLQYQVLKEGKGEKPKSTDQVKVNYVGTLLDGTEFDSSIKRGQPATFPLDKVIAGWTEGVQLMQPGAKYKFFVPPQLGYGKMGSGGVIGPETTLTFEVELLEVLPVKATP
ncbi:MAG: FKBP-type peptidyl-prolyl cis-trans isomerase [Magnetococcales bacterium]|nr:FKBP-type peptidyl-prolyl cis-trans isomerase [Magnetococcales bacterium]HIJ84626.1 FKBP-type peptidyl-prolyl cis-trans isomerase [Magnetococcales bacterium]